MSTEEIIKKNLLFLVNEYHFKYSYTNNRGDHYVYKNEYGYLEYYEWPQFGEKNFYISTVDEFHTINMLNLNPKEISKISMKKKGLKGFFYDEREEYWYLIQSILREEITTTGTLFGLKIK